MFIDSSSFRSPNHNARPKGEISAIVLHSGEGTRASDLETLVKSTGEKAVSAHFYICRDGTIYQLVDVSRRAWHAGESNWNDFSIGIECEHKDGQDWPLAQLAAVTALCKMLIGQYGIKAERVVSHRAIAIPFGRRNDPSNWSDLQIGSWVAITLYGAAAQPADLSAVITPLQQLTDALRTAQVAAGVALSAATLANGGKP